MEHKLILGGEQYLPFARSRIKAMRATGAKYASQRFVMPDAQINVQIVGEHDYIRITGGTLRLPMDSGVVDVFNFAPANPATYLTGTLIEAGAAVSYNAGFVGTPWRKKSGTTGQLTGAINTTAPFNGLLLAGTQAPSFMQGTRPVDPPTNPPTTEPNPADGALADKKATAALCPASIFTGRCRLYVQGIYGRPLHDYGSGLGPVPSPPQVSVVSDTTAAPALLIPTYKPASGGQQTVLLDTNCGIWLDPETGEHYLIQPANGVFKVYPMRAPGSCEGMRKLLVLDPSADGALNDTDKEHLEAYILAYSLPDAKSVVTAGEYTFGSTYSMGYGWHWNWSGTRADIVINNTFDQGGGDFAMESTHIAVSFTKAGDSFSTVVSVIEGPSRWALQRSIWTIVEPNYIDFVLDKTTPKDTTLFDCDAPFYAFYKRDELQVCRVSLRFSEGATANLVESNCFGTQLVTVGLTEGFRAQYGNGAAYWAATFTCGPVSSGALPFAKVTPLTSYSAVRNKEIIGDWVAGYGSEAFGTRLVTTSDDYGNNVQMESVTGYLVDDRQCRNFYYDVFSGAGSSSETGYAQVVVPFYDAEAIFLRAVNQEVQTWTSSTTQNWAQSGFFYGLGWLSRDIYNINFSGPAELVYKSRAQACGAFASAGNTLLTTDATLQPPTTVVTVIAEKLVAGGLAQNVTFDSLSDFTNNAIDTVSATYSVRSSTSVTDPVVISTGYLTPSTGLPSTEPTVPVIVGWI